MPIKKKEDRTNRKPKAATPPTSPSSISIKDIAAPEAKKGSDLKDRLIRKDFAKITITAERGVVVVCERNEGYIISIEDFLEALK